MADLTVTRTRGFYFQRDHKTYAKGETIANVPSKTAKTLRALKWAEDAAAAPVGAVTSTRALAPDLPPAPPPAAEPPADKPKPRRRSRAYKTRDLKAEG